MPGIGLMKRRLEKESDAIALARSAVIKKFEISNEEIKILETKYDFDSGDWYVAIGWKEKKVIVQMDSVKGEVINFKEI